MADHQASRAPPLSVDEVLKAVAGVNWRTLGKWLIGERKEPLMKRYTNLDRIHDTHKSDEARLRAVVEEFIAKTDGSWRRVICALHYAKEIDRAQQISSYAEPLQDPTLTVESFVRVMATMTSGERRRREVWGRVLDLDGDTPSSYLDGIYMYSKYTTAKEKTHALADIYVNSRPGSSWQHLVQILYAENEMAAAKKAKSFLLQNDPTLIVDNLIGVMEKVTSDEGRRREVWKRVLKCDHATPSLYLFEVYSKYTTTKEKTHALADVYVNIRPGSSWQHLVQILYTESELAAAEEAKSFLQQKDPMLMVWNVTRVMEKVTVDNRRGVWVEVLGVEAVEEIYRSHFSQRERLYSCASNFICKADSSRKDLVKVLYDVNEMAAAKEAKVFLQQKDPTLTMENVTRAMEKVTVDKRREVWERLLGKGAVEEIYSSYSSEEEKLHSCADIYANCKPDSSWETLVRVSFLYGEMAAAKEAKSFLQHNDPTLMKENVTRAMEKVTVGKRRGVWEDALGETAVLNIYSSHSSKEEKLHSCADIYANCKPDSSWETLVRVLFFCGEMAAAKEAKSFLQHNDPTLTVENVAGVMEKVVVDKRRQLWERLLREAEALLLLRMPKPTLEIVDQIYSSHSSEKEKTHACSDVYANCCPESSWEHLTSLLYEEDEMTAVDQARPFLPPRDLTLTTDKLTELFQSAKDPNKQLFIFITGIGEFLGLPKSALAEIKRSYQSWAKRKEAYLDTYVHRHPCPSWKKICELLKKYSLKQQADEVEDTYIQVSDRTWHYFDIAMKGGTLMIRNGGVFFLGPGGSGKTCTLHALLLEPPPSVRQSTPCAKRTVRTIAQCKVGVEGVYLIRIQDDQYSDMLSTTAKQLQPQAPSISTATPTPAEEGAMSREDASVPSPASVSQHIEEADSHTTKQEKNPDVSPEKKQKKPSSRRSGFEKELLRRMQLVPKRSENLIDKDLIDMKDSGGQPMFHEVLPLFVKNTTFGVLTVKLNERLDSYPMVDYYSNGKPVGEPFPSPFTHLQTFRHCMRVLQSTCSEGTCPKLVFIGTHKDLEQECPDEDREEKNRKLRSIIPPNLKQSILYYEHSNEELLFGVNVKTPGDIDRKMIGCVRERMIKELRKLPQEKIPLQYFALENAFLRLAKYQRKGVLSKEDCFQEAAAYHFTKESFEAALKYLHGLKLIFYYEEVLPEVVFIDAQTILDKITELVEFSLSVTSHSKPVHELTISMDIKEFQEFKAYGIITLELLSQFSSHYVPGLFMQQQLALLLKYLRVIAEVGKGKYLMPCLLRVSAIPRLLPRSTEPSISALLFYFGPNGPKLGVYCFLLASLITEAKWELVTENDRPVQVSRNQVQFRLPGDDPGVITITDSFSTSFHVSIDFPEDMEADESLQISSRVCPGICETILSTVQKVSHRLNYNNSIPKVAFPCVKHLPDAIHPATISSTGFLTCTIHPTSVYSRLTEQHQIWFGEEVHANMRGVDQSRQVLDQVIDSGHSGVPRHLGQIADTMYEWEGAVADSLGLHQADVAEIKEAHSGKLKLQVRAALEKWKQYNGPRATYRKLIASFEQAGRKNFASKVYEIAGVHSTVTESRIESGQAKACAGAQKKHESATIPPEGGKKPQLAKAFKFLIPIAEEWQNVGTLLELEDDALTSIAAAGKKDIDHLREMLKLWISQEDPVPSWEALAEAVEPFSDEVVAKVKSQCA